MIDCLCDSTKHVLRKDIRRRILGEAVRFVGDCILVEGKEIKSLTDTRILALTNQFIYISARGKHLGCFALDAVPWVWCLALGSVSGIEQDWLVHRSYGYLRKQIIVTARGAESCIQISTTSSEPWPFVPALRFALRALELVENSALSLPAHTPTPSHDPLSLLALHETLLLCPASIPAATRAARNLRRLALHCPEVRREFWRAPDILTAVCWWIGECLRVLKPVSVEELKVASIDYEWPFAEELRPNGVDRQRSPPAPTTSELPGKLLIALLDLFSAMLLDAATDDVVGRVAFSDSKPVCFLTLWSQIKEIASLGLPHTKRPILRLIAAYCDASLCSRSGYAHRILFANFAALLSTASNGNVNSANT
ncbi:hypothetical protein HKX48_004234 [Thoreauomyces humboldtii]|nr:hypothetical protein HKX48_004234 [Thoreauomyces humboldtii]